MYEGLTMLYLLPQGYVNLAKARYDIGSRTGGMISQLQYPKEMTTTINIEWYAPQ